MQSYSYRTRCPIAKMQEEMPKRELFDNGMAKVLKRYARLLFEETAEMT